MKCQSQQKQRKTKKKKNISQNKNKCFLIEKTKTSLKFSSMMDMGWDLEAASQTSMSYVASMAASAASLVTFDSTSEGFPETEMPVWIMGKSYSAIHGKRSVKLKAN
jgi:hypothetical protein